jgi:hypothetical protein
LLKIFKLETFIRALIKVNNVLQFHAKHRLLSLKQVAIAETADGKTKA